MYCLIAILNFKNWDFFVLMLLIWGRRMNKDFVLIGLKATLADRPNCLKRRPEWSFGYIMYRIKTHIPPLRILINQLLDSPYFSIPAEWTKWLFFERWLNIWRKFTYSPDRLVTDRRTSRSPNTIDVGHLSSIDQSTKGMNIHKK